MELYPWQQEFVDKLRLQNPRGLFDESWKWPSNGQRRSAEMRPQGHDRPDGKPSVHIRDVSWRDIIAKSTDERYRGGRSNLWVIDECSIVNEKCADRFMTKFNAVRGNWIFDIWSSGDVRFESEFDKRRFFPLLTAEDYLEAHVRFMRRRDAGRFDR